MNPKAKQLVISLRAQSRQLKNSKLVLAMWQGVAAAAISGALKEDIFAEAVFFNFKDQFNDLTANNPRKITDYYGLCDELSDVDYSESVYYFDWDSLLNIISMFDENSVFIKTLINLINGYRY